MSAVTQYADSGEYSIAYQVIGEGPIDVLLVPGMMSHLDMQWCDPLFSNFLNRLASVSRLIVMDQRGVGLSDRCEAVATIDERVADVKAVIDAVGSDRLYIVGHCHGGPPAIVYAATYPERIEGLVLMSTFAKGTPDANHACAIGADVYEYWMEAVERWGEGHSMRYFNPSRAGNWANRKLYATFERAAVSKGMARAVVASTLKIDVTAALAAVRAPTLVLHASCDVMSAESGRYLARAIPGAQFVAIDGADHAPFMGEGSQEVLDHILDFLGTSRTLTPAPIERFGAILMTDIVESTQAASRLGDESWAHTLMRHDDAVRDDIARNLGECLKFTGDGYLATFGACEDALRCAVALQGTAARFGLAIRCGVHAGSYQPAGQDAVGLAVVIASRLMSATKGPNILVSDAVSNAVAGAGFQFGPARSLSLKGVSSPAIAAELITGSNPTTSAGRWIPDSDEHRPRLTRIDRVLLVGARRIPRAAHIFAKTPEQQRRQPVPHPG
jgi:pimeloyl-ACP methyl ester carboxylesterase/class 3 adenylate cyclase